MGKEKEVSAGKRKVTRYAELLKRKRRECTSKMKGQGIQGCRKELVQ